MNQKELKTLVRYEPETGRFFLLQENRYTGTTDAHGHTVIRLNNSLYRAGRLAWLYMVGNWPIEIDHINRIRNDDRFLNLREATRSLNNANRAAKGPRSTGCRGVQRLPSGRFYARIMNKRKEISVGTFDTVEEASLAYNRKYREFYGGLLANG